LTLEPVCWMKAVAGLSRPFGLIGSAATLPPP
jgi:hypothetical protein